MLENQCGVLKEKLCDDDEWLPVPDELPIGRDDASYIEVNRKDFFLMFGIRCTTELNIKLNGTMDLTVQLYDNPFALYVLSNSIRVQGCTIYPYALLTFCNLAMKSNECGSSGLTECISNIVK